jgi:hypothetical protein
MKHLLPDLYKPLANKIKKARKAGKNHVYTVYPEKAGVWGYLFGANFDVIEGKCKYWWIK